MRQSDVTSDVYKKSALRQGAGSPGVTVNLSTASYACLRR